MNSHPKKYLYSEESLSGSDRVSGSFAWPAARLRVAVPQLASAPAFSGTVPKDTEYAERIHNLLFDRLDAICDNARAITRAAENEIKTLLEAFFDLHRDTLDESHG